MEEERRLAFVGYTRAEQRLYLTEAEGFSEAYGFRFPSRFIFDVDDNILDYKVELSDSLKQKSRNYIEESDKNLEKMEALIDLSPGDKVTHNILGNGKILEIDSAKKTYLIQFENIQTPRKMSFKAPIKKL